MVLSPDISFEPDGKARERNPVISTPLHELAHADIRIMPRRCHPPWSSLAEGCRHSAKFQLYLITALGGGKRSFAQAASMTAVRLLEPERIERQTTLQHRLQHRGQAV
jgi:hypothetical protein